MAPRPSRPRALVALVVLVALAAGCGTKFDLPTEQPGGAPPADKSYQTIAVWPGMDRVRDLLLTQKYGSQLFVLFERAIPDTSSHGEVWLYALTRQVPVRSLLHVNNPVALAAGGDGTGSPLNRVYVLDQGDTCEARANPFTHVCGDTIRNWSLDVSDLFHYWRVREYGLLGGDTLSTFTDTSMAFVRGIAADHQGRVYVAGMAIIYVPDITFHLFTRLFQSRVYRYVRGPRYPGVRPPDRSMPGADWHRDSTWVIVEGSGIGSLMNPHGLEWMDGPAGSALYVSDYDKNWIQRMSDTQSSNGLYQIDGAETGTFLFQAGDVASDADGFVYVCDTGNRRVLRYNSAKEFVQRVDIAEVGGTGPLTNPVAVAANDTLVFIADPGISTVFKMRRLK